MDSIFSTALGPIVVLWIGAFIFYVLDRFLEPQDRGTAEPIVLALALGFLIGARASVDAPVGLGQALPGLSGSSVSPTLVATVEAWLLAFLLLGGTLMASLASLGRPTRGRAGRMAALGAALLYLFAGDGSTIALAWVLVDLSLLLALDGAGSRQALGRAGVLSLAGAVLLAATIPIGQLGAGDGGSLPPELLPWVGGMLVVAALLRVLPAPLPSWRAAIDGGEMPDTRPVVRAIVYALPPLLGTVLWARLGQWDASLAALGMSRLPDARWSGLLTLWGALVLLSGAARAWSLQDPEALVASVGHYACALVLVGAGQGLTPDWYLWLGGTLTLGISALLVAWTQCQHLDIWDVRTYWRAVPTLVVLLSFAGAPLTAGFPVRTAIYWSVFDGRRWLSLLLLIAGEVLFLGALLRVLFELECVPRSIAPDMAGRGRDDALPAGSSFPRWRALVRRAREVDWPGEIGYVAGANLALAVAIMGFAPRGLSGAGLGYWFRLPTLPVWAALLLSVVGAIAIYRSRDRLLAFAEDWWPVLERLFAVEWLYRGVENVLYYVGTLIWGGSLLVEGAGYMAWVLLVCLVVLLFVISR